MTLSDNLRGGLMMTFAMAFFALADSSIKAASAHIAPGLIVLLLGLGSGLSFSLLAASRNVAVLSPQVLAPAILARCCVEIVATAAIVLAVSYADLSTVSAVQQTAPLIVVAGAHLFFGEHIGWRRVLALALGVAGVLLILRPGGAAFEPSLLFAVVAALAFGARDLLTRAVPRSVQSLQLAAWGALSLIPAGLILTAAMGTSLAWDSAAALPMGLAVLTGTVAYYAITAVMRIGDIGAIAPLRYTRLVFAAALGITLFGERPDIWTMLGAGLIVGSGIFALMRTRRVNAE